MVREIDVELAHWIELGLRSGSVVVDSTSYLHETCPGTYASDILGIALIGKLQSTSTALAVLEDNLRRAGSPTDEILVTAETLGIPAELAELIDQLHSDNCIPADTLIEWLRSGHIAELVRVSRNAWPEVIRLGSSLHRAD